MSTQRQKKENGSRGGTFLFVPSSVSFENLFHVSSFSPNNTLLKELSREIYQNSNNRRCQQVE